MMKIKKLIKKPLRNIVQSSFVMNLISWLIYSYARFVGKTGTWQLHGVREFYKLWNKHHGVILVAWHGRALMLPFFWNHKKPLNALVSLHRDGRMIAGLLEKFGLGTIGGSSNENASGAALELMRSLKNDTAICIIPDGPRGPRMHMTKSPVYYAQKTGKPLVGITYSVSKAKFINKSWDKMMVPLPFSKGIVKTTEPLFIPKDATAEQLAAYQAQIEDMLNTINYDCDNAMGIPPILPGNEIGGKRKKYRKEN